MSRTTGNFLALVLLHAGSCVLGLAAVPCSNPSSPYNVCYDEAQTNVVTRNLQIDAEYNSCLNNKGSNCQSKFQSQAAASWAQWNSDIANCGCGTKAPAANCTSPAGIVCAQPDPPSQVAAVCETATGAWDCPPTTDTICTYATQPNSQCICTSGYLGTNGTAWACPETCDGVAICWDKSQPECQQGTWVCDSGTYPACQEPPSIDCETYGASSHPICTQSGWGCTDSPILIDAKGEGFHLTDTVEGVRFTFFPDQAPVQISWTDAAFSNGWLALDRNGDGRIDDATELFGNITPQPPSADPNGYIALAVFDDPQNGGNGNGVIDAGDSIYSQLKVWIDANHNGISEPDELHPLQELGIFKIDLQYTETPYTDAFGNQFRYRAKIWDEAGRDHNACYDVFLSYTAAPVSK